jgi:hypothetical protein
MLLTMGWPSESQNAGPGVQSVENKYQTYAAGTLTKMDINLPKFWEVRLFSFNLMNHSKSAQGHQDEFPTIFRMALDYLPIQASAVPCEQAFSSSAETDTNRRNCVSPNLMEVLQIIKYSIWNDLVDFTAGGSATKKDLTSCHTSEDLLTQLIHTAGCGTSYHQ